MPEDPRRLREIPVEQIVPNRRQPREDFDQDALKALAESIRKAGLMQPIMVRPAAKGFELVAGERRWRAAKLIGLPTIPALVREIDEQTAAELALIENVQREDLNPMERAYALRRLSTDFSLTHQDIADRVGLDRASVTNLLRLSDLDRPTADLVRSGKLSQGHGKALLAVLDLGLRAELAAKSMAGEWSVRELEHQVQQVGTRKTGLQPAAQSGEVNARSANVADLEK
ncbi:MAG: ParB/RepB/Spo0J family partition protein, partial [Planctomycetota bacterium]